MMNKILSVGIAQVNPRLGDFQANLSHCESAVHRVQAQGLDLLVFPELSLTAYHLCDMVATVALRLDAPEIAQLKEWSCQVGLIIGLVEESADYRFYHAAMYLAD